MTANVHADGMGMKAKNTRAIHTMLYHKEMESPLNKNVCKTANIFGIISSNATFQSSSKS